MGWIAMPLLALAVMVHFAVTHAPHVEPWCQLQKDSALSDRGLLSSDNDRVVGVLRMRGGESLRTSTSPAKARQRHTRLESAAWMKEKSAQRSTGSGADRSKKKKKKGLGSGERKTPPTAEAIRAAIHGGKHMSLPSKWMHIVDGEGPEVIEIVDSPATSAVTNIAQAYDDDLDMSDPQRAKQGDPRKKSRARKKGTYHSLGDNDAILDEHDAGAARADGEMTDSDQSESGGKERTSDRRPRPSSSPVVQVRPGLAATVFVGSLNFSTKEQDLAKAFGGSEKVASVRMPRRRDGRRRGIAFVELKSEKLAASALKSDGMLLMGRRIHVRPGLQDADKESLVAARHGEHFGPCGNVTDIHFDEDRETGEFKRSARVSFSSISGVEAAVALHGTRIEGMPQKPIRVTYAITANDIKLASFRKGSITSDRTMGPGGKLGRRGGSSSRPGKQKWRQRRDLARNTDAESGVASQKASSSAEAGKEAARRQEPSAASRRDGGADAGALKPKKRLTGGAKKFLKRQRMREDLDGGAGEAGARDEGGVGGRQERGVKVGRGDSLRLKGGGEWDTSSEDEGKGGGGGKFKRWGASSVGGEAKRVREAKTVRKGKGDDQDQEGGEEELDAREAAGGSDESVLVFSSDANEEKIREGLKRRQEQREAELDSSEHAAELAEELDYQLRQTARELKARGIRADPDRLRRMILQDEDPSASDADQTSGNEREPSPTAWRVHGDRRYPVSLQHLQRSRSRARPATDAFRRPPRAVCCGNGCNGCYNEPSVYPGHEDFDKLAGPNSRQLFINKEGIDYSFEEGGPRPWPRSAINDTRPVGFRWVDTHNFPENFGLPPLQLGEQGDGRSD